MKTTTYVRKPFYIQAVRVTESNMDEIAQWCGGEVEVRQSSTDEKPIAHVRVRVHRPLNERQTTAFIGDWVLEAETGFKIYTAKAFEKSFDKVRHLTKEQADRAGIRPPIEKKAKKKPPRMFSEQPAQPMTQKIEKSAVTPMVIPPRKKDAADMILQDPTWLEKGKQHQSQGE